MSKPNLNGQNTVVVMTMDLLPRALLARPVVSILMDLLSMSRLSSSEQDLLDLILSFWVVTLGYIMCGAEEAVGCAWLETLHLWALIQLQRFWDPAAAPSSSSLLLLLCLMHPSVLRVLWHSMRHSLDGALINQSWVDTSSLMCSLCCTGMNDFVGDSLNFWLLF